MKIIIAIFLLMVAIPGHAVQGPEQLIRDTTDKVLTEMRTRADYYASNADSLFNLVEEVVLPHFDFDQMTNLALGRYEEQVTPAQLPLIVKEFRTLLVRTYGKALLEYTDEVVTFLPMEGSVAEGKVTVRTEIAQAGGFPIPLNYSLKLRDNGWKVFDISVDDISLVTNYRSSFARAIKKDGVDGLIKTLRDRNQQ
ncbi:MAG: phospholipid transport system substrate-binding protein [Planctomycetota bacterium]|jgi:phospholipid transport system substrate-binding protein